MICMSRPTHFPAQSPRRFGAWLASVAWLAGPVFATPPGTAPEIRITPGDIPNKGILYVNREADGRSGHGNQALAECTNGDLLSFYPNTDGAVMAGHSTTGWTEYRRSNDGGRTWSAPTVLEYSKAMLLSKDLNSALVEEAVTAPNGTVIAFVGRYTKAEWWRTTPVYLTSRDNGRTWSAPRPVDPAADIAHLGRTHAVCVHQGTIYVLFDSGTHNSKKDGTGHKLYVSTDNGGSFQRRSALPFGELAWYGAMNVIQGNRLIAYVYNNADERNIEYATSDDFGATWSAVQTTLVAKALRNPQLSSEINGVYLLHGRSGHQGPEACNLVLYRSTDGIHWDEGVFLNKGPNNDADSYSTNEVLGKYSPGGPQRLLIQASVAYDGKRRVNLHHWFIEPTARARP